MRLKLKELKQVVDNTLAEEKSVDALREEISRVLGPSVDTDVKLKRLAEGANDRIDVLERTGRAGRLDFKPAVLLKFANNTDPEVRRFVARVLPENFIAKFKLDTEPAVRHAVARRLPLAVVKEMLNRNISDDELRAIYREKKLQESAETELKNTQKHYATLNAAAQQNDDELSDQWYTSAAHKAISDYNHNLEGQWDEPWVHRYCASLRTTSNIHVDELKLWKEIQKQLKDRDDRTLERYSLKEVAKRLRENFDHDDPTVVYTEAIDPVKKLLESDLSSTEFVRQAKQIFNIRESIMPSSLRKYMVSEGRTSEIMIPCLGKVPGRRSVTRLDERALDSFVKRWNDVQHQHGEPIRINWAHNPSGPGMITFNVELK